jgi:hypothetical protein
MIGIGLHIANRVMGGGGGFDADAQAFFDRVTTAGGTLSTTEKNATNQLVLDMKSAGIWTSMKAIYPMVGASAAACAQNLKSSSFTGTFSSGWTFASTGVTPNGTSAYMDTTLISSTALSSINNVHLSFYSRTQNTTTGAWNMGVDSGAPLFGILNLGQYFAAVSQKLFNNGSYPTYAVTSTQTNTKGLAIGVAESSVLRKLHFNGSLLATTTTTTTTPLPAKSIYIGSGRNSTTGNAADFSPHECSLASIGDGLTDTQASNFYTAVQAFQTTLSRQV